MNRWKKLIRLCCHPVFIPPLLHHRVAAGIEHYSVVQYLAPGTLIDAGANKGQFSLLVRKLFPKTRIIAFEPLPEAAERYERLFRNDKCTTLHRLALDINPGERIFYVADRGDSSSLLPPAQGLQVAFGSTLSHEISVQTIRLDKAINLRNLVAPVLLKIDVQGAESQVIESAKYLLKYIDYIYVEVLFTELYDGQSRFNNLFRTLDANGYRMRGVFNQVITSEYNATCADVLFTRNHTENILT